MPLRVCILGGTGFVGHSIAAKLCARGHTVRIITRRRERHRDLLVLPTVHVIQGDPYNTALLLKEFRMSDVVINLVGILNEKGYGGDGFKHAHVTFTANVLEACVNSGITRFLHMSALNASSNAPSHYLRTKAEAETMVRKASEAGLQTTVFRPSVIFGPRDSFLNRFASLLKLSPVFPLAMPQAKFQPIYVEDVAEVFIRAMDDHRTFGKTYDLCGPRVYSLAELVNYVAEINDIPAHIIQLNPTLSWLQAAILGLVPGKPFSIDNLNSLKVDSVCKSRFPKELGIVPRSLEGIAPVCAEKYHDRFAPARRSAGR